MWQASALSIEREMAGMSADLYREKEAEVIHTAEAEAQAKGVTRPPMQEGGIWTTMACVWKGVCDYLGEEDLTLPPSPSKSGKEGEGGERRSLPSTQSKSTLARARPLVLAGLGGVEHAPPKWEAPAGLESQMRIWLPEFALRLKSIYIPLPTPAWQAAHSEGGGEEGAARGVREIPALEKQAIVRRTTTAQACVRSKLSAMVLRASRRRSGLTLRTTTPARSPRRS